ncbi:MAG: hypothetical protein R3308_02100, partial [Thiohalobacterales bacterium]|nr:hypothetical protein [Thiohalobacterales bacterium]
SHSEALPSRLVCSRCGNWQTTLVSGDEMELTSIELITGQNENRPTERGAATAGATMAKTD